MPETISQSKTHDVERLFGPSPVLCDGAMGTMFYARGVFINRCFDELNLTDPQMVRELHEEYLLAGAEVIETNTFGANAARLKRFGLEGKVAEINTAAVRIARAAVNGVREKHAHQAFVAGALGSLGFDKKDADPAMMLAAYTEQVNALVAAGVDLFVVETITSLAQAKAAIQAARDAAPELPVIAMITVTDAGIVADGTSPEDAARLFEEWGARAVGCNCSDGPMQVLDTIERMRKVTKLPIAAMPNAGLPNCVDGRSIYLSSPEYLASFARKAMRVGATIIGGCCGTTPKHIKAMRSSVKAIQAQAEGVLSAGAKPAASAIEPVPLAERSTLGGRIARGEFVSMVEIVPPKGIDATRELEGARMLKELGIHAINVPDSPRASTRMSAGSMCLQIEQKVGIETVIHYTCRDRNLLGIQSELLGASSLGLRNVLCLTGDPPKMGSYPDATAVFDVDAVGLTRIVRDMNHGLDIGGNSIGSSTGFVIAVAANPGVPDLDAEVRRFAAKVEAGAEFGITQPVFDMRLLETFLKRIESFRIPIVAGIWPLTSVKNAEFMKNDLKVRMPDEILSRMAAHAETPEHSRAEGILIAQEMLSEARSMVQGVQVSAPFARYAAAAEVLQAML
ncbi:bifunctional homocysteine S-methyltransferase/methylenetetrahydrofolate reductase [Terriglobus roseus]|uniref:Homocysteine S-methyltransferase n=1 Tax=Terriglobus roseus TaxID=392734 RepID=A0A1H4JJU2_9BACT|nr:bifunctional homocysteine S-methyltransferase/methylenetetrahydrofolate reductase [Terriglobus roseus]SEB45948.1 homocysteine S-methyltransferase [Terriglobus roseus]